MNKDKIMRFTLWATALFDFSGASIFLFPESLGRMAGIPLPVSPFYTITIATFLLLFGCVYLWMLYTSQIDRLFIAVAAIGKTLFFSTSVIFYLQGDAQIHSVLVASGDLVSAIIFTWWLLAL